MSTAGPAVRTPSPRTPSPRTQTVSIVTAAAGQNVIYTVVTTFMLLYLLEYAGFGPGQIAIATTVIAVVRIVDAIGDPIVGSLIDMTRTRWGKLRPFILFSAVPVAVLTTLLFA
ncbi:MAG TPA: MFS transporter, partial [Pseudolysinimonas sp.]|nr:MFS transporter [Pseudolysinimonas sp.]